MAASPGSPGSEPGGPAHLHQIATPGGGGNAFSRLLTSFNAFPDRLSKPSLSPPPKFVPRTLNLPNQRQLRTPADRYGHQDIKLFFPERPRPSLSGRTHLTYSD